MKSKKMNKREIISLSIILFISLAILAAMIIVDRNETVALRFSKAKERQIKKKDFDNFLIVKLKNNHSQKTGYILSDVKNDILDKEQLFTRDQLSHFKDKNIFDNVFLLKVKNSRIKYLINKLSKNKGVDYVSLDHKGKLDVIPNDPEYTQQWQYRSSRYLPMETSWGSFKAKDKPVIAFLDSGLLMSHEDLRPRVWTNPNEIPDNGIDDDHNGYIDDVHGWNFFRGKNKIDDFLGHGTMTTGVAVAVPNNRIGIVGMNWQGKVMPIVVTGTSSGIMEHNIIRALVYASSFSNVRVMNMSFGFNIISPLFRETIKSLVDDNKIVLVGSAGNSSRDISYHHNFPANFKGVMAVASYSRNAFSYFSNFGPQIDVVAPGDGIYSTIYQPNSYGHASGTSLSAPFVSATALSILAKYPEFTAQQAIQAIRLWSYCSLNKINCPVGHWNNKYGYGRLNGEGAINDKCQGSIIKSETLIENPEEGKEYQRQQEIKIIGKASSNHFWSYYLEWGKGSNPTSWSSKGITLVNPNKQFINEGELGTFNLSTLSEGGLYVLRLRLKGDNPCRRNFVGEDVVSFFVEQTFKISGYVRKKTKDVLSPAPGIVVQFYRDGKGVGWARTDKSGAYKKERLLPGNYIVKPISSFGEEYEPSSRSLLLSADGGDLSNENFIRITDSLR